MKFDFKPETDHERATLKAWRKWRKEHGLAEAVRKDLAAHGKDVDGRMKKLLDDPAPGYAEIHGILMRFIQGHGAPSWWSYLLDGLPANVSTGVSSHLLRRHDECLEQINGLLEHVNGIDYPLTAKDFGGLLEHYEEMYHILRWLPDAGKRGG